MMPPGLNAADSARMVTYLKEQWGRDQAIQDEVLKLLPGIEKEMESRIAEYSRTLFVQAFDNYLIEHKLDTVIPSDSIVAYYEKEKNNFISREDQFSYFYIAAPDEGSGEVSEMMNSNSQSEINRLRDWAKQKAIFFRLDSSYVNANILEQDRKGYLSSLENTSRGQLIKWSGVIQGQRRKYFFKMLNSIDEGESLPLELVKEEIRQILLNARKQRLIETEHNRVFSEAVTQSTLQTDL